MQTRLDGLANILKTGNFEEELEKTPSGRDLPKRSDLEKRIGDMLDTVGKFDRPQVDFLRTRLNHAVEDLFQNPDPLKPLDDFVVESMVIADGSRPVFFFQDGKLKPGFGTGPFVDRLTQQALMIEQISGSVGRIESDLRIAEEWMGGVFFLGTAFRVGPDLAMTNRHVAQQMIRGSADGSGPFSLNGPWWLNFLGEHGSVARRRFAVTEIAWAPQHPILPQSNLSLLDMALLRIGPAEFGGTALPPQLPVSFDPVFQGQQVGVIGYPGKPRVIVDKPDDALKCDEESERALARVFDGRFGFKRCGAGEIDAQTGFPGDTGNWTVKHDVSTLGGNSGSPVFDLTSTTPRILALHFGGCTRKENYGAVFESLRTTFTGLGIEAV